MRNKLKKFNSNVLKVVMASLLVAMSFSSLFSPIEANAQTIVFPPFPNSVDTVKNNWMIVFAPNDQFTGAKDTYFLFYSDDDAPIYYSAISASGVPGVPNTLHIYTQTGVHRYSYDAVNNRWGAPTDWGTTDLNVIYETGQAFNRQIVFSKSDIMNRNVSPNTIYFPANNTNAFYSHVQANYGNDSPTRPGALTSPTSGATLNGGTTYPITWGTSTDPQGQAITYQVEVEYRLENGTLGGWSAIATGVSANTINYKILSDQKYQAVHFKVSAIDVSGSNSYSTAMQSNFFTTNVVLANRSPSAPGAFTAPAGTNLTGGMTVPLSHGASTDPDGDAITYEREVSYNGGAYVADGSSTLMTRNAVLSSNPADTSARWRVRAKDVSGSGGASVWTYSNTYTLTQNPMVITVNSYNTNPTNQPITVTASVNVGTLNATSHTFSENGSFDFIATDTNNRSVTKTVTVSNIDITPPAAAILLPNTVAPTNGNVVVTINYPADATVKQFRIDGGAWQTYSGAITMTGNGTVSARSQDAVGNWSSESSYSVSNIDKTAPVAATFAANVTAPTSGNVAVTMNYPADATVKQFRIDSGAWQNYNGAVNMTGNGTVSARSQDAVGNWSSESSYVVNNIDRTAPVAATLSSSVTAPTNGDVAVTISYPADANVKQFRIDNGSWQTYNGAVTITGNGTVFARSNDAAGNWSEESSYSVNNIDKVAPLAATLSANMTSSTNQNVIVTIAFPQDANVKQYKVGSSAWTAYTAPVVLKDNDTVFARSQDVAGNWSEENSIFVTNIDKIAPANATLTADKTLPTNGNVTVTVVYPADAISKEIKVNGGAWQKYTDPISFSDNGTMTARSTDAAGNVSIETSYDVKNIDKVAPDKPILSANKTAPTNTDVTVSVAFPTDAAQKLIRIGNGAWKSYADPIVLATNDSISAKSIDEAGNESQDSLIVSNIDKITPDAPILKADITKPTNGNVVVNVTFPTDAAVKEYKIDNGNWMKYTIPIVISGNAKVSARATDEVGNVSSDGSLIVSNIDITAPDNATISASSNSPINQTVSVDVAFPKDAFVKEYRLNGGAWTDYKNAVAFEENGQIEARSQDVAGNWSGVTSYDVNNIDKVAPNAPTLKADVTKSTNKDVTISITFPSDASKKEFKNGSGEWTLYTSPILVKQNDTVQARAWDVAGNVSEVASIDVTNIDKILPTVPTIEVKVDTITVTPGTDASGIADTQLRINGGSWQSYISPITLKDGEYTVEVKSIDTVTNENSTSTHFFVYVDTLRDAEVKVSYAERFASAPQSKIDEAKTVVDKLPDAAPEKKLLLDRLMVVLAKASSSSNLSDLMKLEREVDLGVADATKITDWNSDLSKTKAIVDAMPDGSEKTSLLNKISGIENKMNAVEKISKSGTGDVEIIDLIGKLPNGSLKDRLQNQVDNQKESTVAKANLSSLEQTPNWIDLGKMKSQISALSDQVPEKADLLNRLKKVEDLLKAKDAVAKAEQTMSQSDASAALTAIKAVSDETEMQSLANRMTQIADQVAVVSKIEKAEGSHSQDGVDAARSATNAMPNGELKTKLLNRLNSIDAELNNAIVKLKTSEISQTEANIRNAEDAITNMVDSPQKDELKTRLVKAKDQLADKNAAGKIAFATDKVTQAEQYKRDPYLTDAATAVNALSDNAVKMDLLNRLNVLNEDIRKANEVVEDGQFTPGKDITKVSETIKDPAAKRLYTDWTKSVIRGEKFFARSNIQVAIKMMDGVPTSVQQNPKYKDLYAEMVKRTNDLKSIYNQLVADKKLEAATSKATNALDFFERYPTEAYKQKAQDAVNALPDGLIKISLQKRIEAVTAK